MISGPRGAAARRHAERGDHDAQSISSKAVRPARPAADGRSRQADTLARESGRRPPALGRPGAEAAPGALIGDGDDRVSAMATIALLDATPGPARSGCAPSRTPTRRCRPGP